MGMRLVDVAKNQLGLAAVDALVIGFLAIAELQHVPLGPLAAVLPDLELVGEILAVSGAIALVVEHAAGGALGVPRAHPTGNQSRLAAVAAALGPDVGEEEPRAGAALPFLRRSRIEERRELGRFGGVDVGVVEMCRGGGREGLAGDLEAEEGEELRRGERAIARRRRHGDSRRRRKRRIWRKRRRGREEEGRGRESSNLAQKAAAEGRGRERVDPAGLARVPLLYPGFGSQIDPHRRTTVGSGNNAMWTVRSGP